jgi:hypothetical protein
MGKTGAAGRQLFRAVGPKGFTQRVIQMAALDIYDAPLTIFLVGRFARESLRQTLEGLVLSDLCDMTVDDFLGGIEKKDHHLARIFWTKVLTPVWESWMVWNGLSEERNRVDRARRALQDALAAAQQQPPVNGAVPLN